MSRNKRMMSDSARELPAFTFRLTFRFYDLECWRELRVPKTFTFEDFHTAIQACLSWLNYHLYDFRYTSKGKKWQVSWPSFETGGNPLDDFGYWFGAEKRPRWADAATIRLDEVFPRTRTALYSYDYGDGWEIDVKLIDSKTPLLDESPLCVAGEGDNPPEDVGAEWGFIEFLRSIADPNDPEHDDNIEWGEGQTFEHFNIENTNARLARYEDWRAKGVYDKLHDSGDAGVSSDGSGPTFTAIRGGGHAAAPTHYHKGALAGLSEDKRRDAIDANDDLPEFEAFDFMFDNPVATLRSKSRSGAPKFALRELLTSLKKDVLVGYANAANIEGVRDMKKAQLVETIAATLRDSEVLGSVVESIPATFLDKVQEIIAADGRLYLPEGKIESLEDIMPPFEPFVFLYCTKHCFVYTIPDELLEAARGLDWDNIRRLAHLRDKLRKLACASVELRGIVPVYEFLEECKTFDLGIASDEEAVRLTVEAACTMPLFAFLATEDESFLLESDLADAYLEEAGPAARVEPEAPIITGPLVEAFERLLILQGDQEPRPVPPAILEYPLAALWREELPATRKLRNWLDEHVPDDANDYRFADCVVSKFCDEVRWGNAEASSPTLYQDILADEGLVLGKEDAGVFLDHLAAFLSEQPTWPNSGWSSDELAKR